MVAEILSMLMACSVMYDVHVSFEVLEKEFLTYLYAFVCMVPNKCSPIVCLPMNMHISRFFLSFLGRPPFC